MRNQIDFNARRKARLVKARFEQGRQRSAFGAVNLRPVRPAARSAEYVEGLDPLWEGEVVR